MAAFGVRRLITAFGLNEKLRQVAALQRLPQIDLTISFFALLQLFLDQVLHLN